MVERNWIIKHNNIAQKTLQNEKEEINMQSNIAPFSPVFLTYLYIYMDEVDPQQLLHVL